MVNYDYSGIEDPITRFFVRVNEDGLYRIHFLLHPVTVIEEDLGISLTEEQAHSINKLKTILVQKLRGISCVPAGIEGLLDYLKDPKKLSELMDDDSVVA